MNILILIRLMNLRDDFRLRYGHDLAKRRRRFQIIAMLNGIDFRRIVLESADGTQNDVIGEENVVERGAIEKEEHFEDVEETMESFDVVEIFAHAEEIAELANVVVLLDAQGEAFALHERLHAR